jgi:hypothetical protein
MSKFQHIKLNDNLETLKILVLEKNICLSEIVNS